MKTLYESILTNDTITESLLSDIEDTLTAGEDYDKIYKKAERDYKKLINKITGKSVGQYYVVSMKSPELAKIISSELPVYIKYSDPNTYNYIIDSISIIYNIDDAFDGEHARDVQFNVEGKLRNNVKYCAIVAASIPYTDENENIENPRSKDNGVGLKEAVKIISNAFAEKYKTLNDFKQAFLNNIAFTRKYN